MCASEMSIACTPLCEYRKLMCRMDASPIPITWFTQKPYPLLMNKLRPRHSVSPGYCQAIYMHAQYACVLFIVVVAVRPYRHRRTTNNNRQWIILHTHTHTQHKTQQFLLTFHWNFQQPAQMLRQSFPLCVGARNKCHYITIRIYIIIYIQYGKWAHCAITFRSEIVTILYYTSFVSSAHNNNNFAKIYRSY